MIKYIDSLELSQQAKEAFSLDQIQGIFWITMGSLMLCCFIFCFELVYFRNMTAC